MMYAFGHTLFTRSPRLRIFLGLALLLLIAATRWPWINCDGGVPSLNEYGYFVTDEGYYNGGAKEKLVWGSFVDIVRGETYTFALTPALHLMTYVSYKIFGQTTWGHRLFPFLINMTAWIAMYWLLSRRTPPVIGFMFCTAIVMTPFVIEYERTACNDVLMASLLLLGLCLTQHQSLWCTILSGVLFGLGFFVKKSIMVLFLFGLCGVLMQRGVQRRWLRVLVFAVIFALTGIAMQFALRWCLWHDAVAQQVSVKTLIEASSAAYGLPNIFDWRGICRGISSFPRVPTDSRLGIMVVFFFLLPSVLFLRRFCSIPRRVDGRLLFYLCFPLYTCAIIIMNTYYAHYFLPLIVLLPLLFVEARKDLHATAGSYAWLQMAGMILLVVGLLLMICRPSLARRELQSIIGYVSQAYNLPEKILWLFNGRFILAFAATMSFLLLPVMLQNHRILTALCVFGSCLLAGNLSFSLYPVVQAAPFVPGFQASRHVAVLILAASAVVVFFVWQPIPALVSGLRWCIAILVLQGFGFLQNRNWRTGMVELSGRSHLQNTAVGVLRKVLPPDAVVTGERAPQLLLTLPARAVPSSNDTIPILQKISAANPQTSFYCLADPQHSYVWQYYARNPDKIVARSVCKLTLPGFALHEPVDVQLVQLILKNAPDFVPRP